MKLLAEENIKIEDLTVHLNLFKLHKSFLLLISDQPNMGIGNVTLSSPPINEGIRSPTASYNLFGMNTKLLSTIIAERASNILKAPVLLLLFLKSKKEDEEVIKPLVNFLNKVLKKITE
ncbi:MAG: hypothetical protein HWN81_10730 [Candidatus Lokiarchaeota archaeon]|nr:hypothetical protein [Candidatus Lokiarchaeota archaeon]